MPTIEVLTVRAEAISPQTPGSDVYARFERDPDILVIPVVEGDRPVGLVERNAFLVLMAAQRARQISGGAELTIDRDRDKNPVVALREIAEETITPDDLHEALVSTLQRVRVDDDDAPDEIGSLAASAEALRLTAAAPPRNQNIGGDYE